MTDKTVILLDGGMGQEIIKRSGKAPTPLWSARVMLDNPEIVEEVHLDFIKAGARVIALNNYSATPDRLARDASVDLFEPIHNAAINTAQSARNKSGQRHVRIAGCLPPLFASYKPELVPTLDECVASYEQLVDVQNDGVDLYICETLSTVREGEAAVTAAKKTNKPVWVSFTLEDGASAKLRSGESLSDAMVAAAKCGADAIMINCSQPETVEASLDVLVAGFPVVGAYANGFQSIDALDAGGTVAGLKAREDLGPDDYARYALSWVQRGLSIIGGCCEVGPDHIAALRAALEADGYTIKPSLA